MGIENDLRDGAKKLAESSRTFVEEYVSSSAALAGRYFEALRKTVQAQSRTQAIDELLKTSLDAVALVPRLVMRHFLPHEEPVVSEIQSLNLSTKNDTPVAAEFTILNSTGTVRNITVASSPWSELPGGPEFPSDMVSISPATFDVGPGAEQIVTVTIAPSPSFAPGKKYRALIQSAGGLTGSIEVALAIESC